MSRIGKAIEFVTEAEFLYGMFCGAVALAASAPGRRARGRDRPPIWGLLLVGSVVAAAWIEPATRLQEHTKTLTLGVALLAAGGGALGDLLHAPVISLGLCAVPPAVILTVGPDGPPWSGPLMVVMVAVGGALVADFDRSSPWRRMGPPLFALSIGGVFVTVPETHGALLLLGAAVPLTFLGSRNGHRLGEAGAMAAVGALGWAIATGGGTRPSALVGASGCLGLLAIEPVLRRLDRRSAWLPATMNTGEVVVLFAIQALVVLVAARVAGFAATAATAAAITCLALVAATLMLATQRLVRRPTPSEAPELRAPD